MRKLLASVYTSILVTGIVVLFNSCSKEHGSKTESLPGISPTVNPIPYSTIVYLIKPTDKTWNVDYYNAAKSSMLELKDWYKQQLGGKTFILNPVIIDTLSGLHDATWYDSNNGDSLGYTGDAHAYYNIKYELKQILVQSMIPLTIDTLPSWSRIFLSKLFQAAWVLKVRLVWKD